jgi:hypothetical protein
MHTVRLVSVVSGADGDWLYSANKATDGEHYGSNFNDAEAAGRSHVSTPDTVNEVTSAGTASQLTGDTHSSQQVASYTNASTPDPNVLKITHTTTFEVGDQKVTMEFDAGVGPDRELIREIQKIWAMAVRFEITDNVSLQKLVKLAQVSVGRSP